MRSPQQESAPVSGRGLAFGGPPHADDAAHIEIRDLRHTFMRDGMVTHALDGMDLQVRTGELVSVVGPSGCGKSTMLRIVAGLLPFTSGLVQVGGKTVSGPQTDLGIVFQSPVLLDWRNVLDNVLVQIELRGLDANRYRDKARKLLADVGLADFHDRRPRELSGGMRQRVAIVRALIHDPTLLMMDEPFGALDAMTRESMNLELLKIRERTGATIMLVTHSIPEAVFLGDRVVVMSPRPGRVTQLVDVTLPAQRTLDLINTDRFGAYVSSIRANLNASGGLD